MSDDRDEGQPTLRVEEFLELLQNSRDPELTLLRRAIDAAARRHPDLPETIRFAAIARRLNAEILGVLRGREDDEAGNRELMAALAELSFTRVRQDGDHAFQHWARNRLLDEWRSSPERQEEFATYNQRLSDYYQDRHSSGRGYAEDLTLAATVLRRASLDRFLKISARVETLEVEPLIEALYHETLQSAEAGYRLFQRHALQYERESRATVCGSLLTSMRDNFQRLPQEALGNYELWLDYWEGRLANLRRSYAEGALLLRRVKEQAEVDPKLLSWTLSDLGLALQNQDDLAGSGEIFQQELELAESTQVDLFNLPASHSRVAGNLQTRGELDRAIEAYRRTIRSARERNNFLLQVTSRLDLAATLAERGRPGEGLACALEAMDLLRSSAEPRPDLEGSMLERMMALVRFDPPLLDTLHREATGLLRADGDPLPRLALDLSYTELLQIGGQVGRAEEMLTKLTVEASGNSDLRFLSGLIIVHGILQEAQGALEAAIQSYSAVTQIATGTDWNFAAALSNRGLVHRQSGAWAKALEDLRKAREHWMRIGHARLAASMAVMQAGVYERRFRTAELERLLARGPDSTAPGEFHRLGGELHQHHARLAEAERAYAEAVAASGGAPVTVARSWLARAVLAARRADWAAAAQFTSAASSALAEGGSGGSAGGRAGTEAAGSGNEDLARAEALLDEAAESLGEDYPLRMGNLLEERAAVLRGRGRRDEAREPLLRACACYRSVQQDTLAAFTLAEVVDLEVEAGRWSEAGRYLDELGELWNALARANAYRPAESDRANDNNAVAFQAVVHAGRGRVGWLRAGREAFRSAAAQQPSSPWFPLNQAYAAMHLGDWADAAEAMETALRRAPKWFPTMVFNERLARFHLRCGHERADAGNPEGALFSFRRARALLEEVSLKENFGAPAPVDAWLDAGDGFLKIENFDEAEEWYTACLGRLGPQPPSDTIARLESRLALLDSRRGRLVLAVEHMARVVGAQEEPGGVALLAGELGALATSEAMYRAAAEPLRALAATLAPGSSARARALDAQLQLASTRYAAVVLGERPDDASAAAQRKLLLVTPLAVDASPALFPPGEAWTESHPLFLRYIPEMRQRVEAETGVTLPGVRIRADEALGPDGFRVLLNETVLCTERVLPEGRFCPDPDRLHPASRAGALPAHNPRTGRDDGVWLASGAEGQAGAPLWDPLEYMVHRLEEEVRSHLGSFLGLQELGERLRAWCAAGADAETRDARHQRVAQALPDLAARVRFLGGLHLLLRESVPVADLDTLLEVFEQSEGQELAAVVEEARFALRGEIPAAEPSRTFVRLSSAVESALARSVVTREGKRFLSLDPEWAQMFTRAAAAALEGLNLREVSVVAEQEEVRPYLWTLMSTGFPGVSVVAARELDYVDLTGAAVLELDDAAVAAGAAA